MNSRRASQQLGFPEELFATETSQDFLFFQLEDKQFEEHEPEQSTDLDQHEYYNETYSQSLPINIPFNNINTQQLSYSPHELYPHSFVDQFSPISPLSYSPSINPISLQNSTFSCVCQKRFATLTALKNHAKMHTNRERNFICDVCKKAFLRKQDLKRHETTHLEDYHPFQCPGCATTFTRSDALSRHIKAKRCTVRVTDVLDG